MSTTQPTTISEIADELERIQNELRRLQNSVEMMERTEENDRIPAPFADEL